MLLGVSGLAREERVLVQAPINIERDFDRVADALTIQHPRIQFRESRKRAKRKGKDGIKRVGKVNTLAVKSLEQVLITRTSLPLKITVMMTTRSN